MLNRILLSIFSRSALRIFRRSSRVVNPADPTQLTRWLREPKRGLFRLRIDLTAIREIEVRIELIVGWHRLLPVAWRHRYFLLYRFYGSRGFWPWLVGRLEDAYDADQAQYDDDPMGRLSDYE